MDIEKIVAEVLKRVQERKAEDEKEKLLILTDHHGMLCQDLYDNLSEKYNMECAFNNEYEDLKCESNTVILFNLDVKNMTKLADGIFDTPYLEIAGRSILEGKKVYAISEDIELFNFTDTAPKKYYSMLEKKLEFLKESGVEIIEADKLCKCLLNMDRKDNITAKKITEEIEELQELKNNSSEVLQLEKKALTERDLVGAREKGINQVSICNSCMITDIAEEYAERYKITIVRRA